MSGFPEAILLPGDLVEQAQLFSIDFGGSVIKIAYKLPDEKADEDGKSRVYLTQYPSAKLQDALLFIRDTVPLPTSGEQQEITMTGIGTFEHQATIEKELGIKVKTVWEGHCTDRLFYYLVSTLSDEQLYFPPLAVEDESTEAFAIEIKAWVETILPKKIAEVEPWKHSGHRRWPCLNVVLGSVFTNSVIMEDSSKLMVAYYADGGRAFNGLGSLLTGAKTFDELIALAEAGNDSTVNIYAKDFMKNAPVASKEDSEDLDKNDPEDNGYSTLQLDVDMFNYGWAVGKNLCDFKKENLARALLRNTCANVIQSVRLVANKMQISNVIVSGGFAMTPVIRSTLEVAFIKAQAIEQSLKFSAGLKDATFRTMKIGGHLGAIGCMFTDVNLPVAVDKNTA